MFRDIWDSVKFAVSVFVGMFVFLGLFGGVVYLVVKFFPVW